MQSDRRRPIAEVIAIMTHRRFLRTLLIALAIAAASPAAAQAELSPIGRPRARGETAELSKLLGRH